MEKNFAYDKLFEQYQDENPCWDEFVSDSFYYELMSWYDSKHNFDDDQGHSEGAINFANYVWDMYIMDRNTDEENRDMPENTGLEKEIKRYVKNISLANSKNIQEQQLAACARYFTTLCKENLTIYLLEKFDQEISSVEKSQKDSKEIKYTSHVKSYDEGFLHAMMRARDIIFKNYPVFYSGNTKTEQQIANAIEMNEPLGIVHNGKFYKVHDTFVINDVKHYKIETEPNFYIWVCNYEEVHGLNK